MNICQVCSKLLVNSNFPYFITQFPPLSSYEFSVGSVQPYKATSLQNAKVADMLSTMDFPKGTMLPVFRPLGIHGTISKRSLVG